MPAELSADAMRQCSAAQRAKFAECIQSRALADPPRPVLTGCRRITSTGALRLIFADGDSLDIAPDGRLRHYAWLAELPMRVLGQTLTLTRSQWADLRDELRTDSETYRRVVDLLTRHAQEAT